MTSIPSFKKVAFSVLKTTGLLGFRTKRSLISVPIAQIRCQETPFSALQGFSGKPIEYFPPSHFFELSLTEPQHAFDAFADWLRICLRDLQAWKVPRSQGGWANGTLVTTIFEVHREHGIPLTDFEQADPILINEAIVRRTQYYFGILDSIRQKGFNTSLFPPIYCRPRNDFYVIADGHHRVSALWVLGYSEANVCLIP